MSWVRDKNVISIIILLFLFILINRLTIYAQHRVKRPKILIKRPYLGKRTKAYGCVSQGSYPDRACTPGGVMFNITVEQVCHQGYEENFKNLSEEVEREVYREYGIMRHQPGEYEINHLIPSVLGGSNSIANLWPMSAKLNPGILEKAKVENYLREQVCLGQMLLGQAQSTIAYDWVKIYKAMGDD